MSRFEAANDAQGSFERFHEHIVSQTRRGANAMEIRVEIPREIRDYPDDRIRQAMTHLVAKAFSRKQDEAVDYASEDFTPPAGVSIHNEIDRSEPECPTIQMTLTDMPKSRVEEADRRRDIATPSSSGWQR